MDIFTLIYPFSSLSPSLWETARYRLKYCLKRPLNPKQLTNQPMYCLVVQAGFYSYVVQCSTLDRMVWRGEGDCGGMGARVSGFFLLSIQIFFFFFFLWGGRGLGSGLHKCTSYDPDKSIYDHFDLYLTPVTLT